MRCARIDPRGVMVLDVNTANNSRTLEPDRVLPRKIGFRLMGLMQRFLGLLSF